MKLLNIAKITASGLVMGAAMAGFGPLDDGNFTVSAMSDPAVSLAAKAAQNAQKAMAKGQIEKFVRFAEAAVANQPSDARYRLLLGDAYLAAGRFQSAEASFKDVLDLSPGHQRGSLKLALSQIALGKIDAARDVIASVKDGLSTADYGLAMTLVGDTETAIAALEGEIRANGGDPKSRQNLALAYAFAGKWAQSRVLASQDLSPDLVDARMTQWAALARPQTSYDQVASVLGVKPAYDVGQPVALALNMNRGVEQVAAAPVNVTVVEPAPVLLAAAEAPVAEVLAPERRFIYEMGPRREIVQPIPARIQTARAPVATPLVRAQAKPMKTALVVSAAAKKPGSLTATKGQFVLQLGAFGSQAAAKTMWTRLSNKVDGLGSRSALTATVSAKGKTLHRLAASGFASFADAQSACAKVKGSGGACFVRAGGAADSIRWAALQTGKPVQLASR